MATFTRQVEDMARAHRMDLVGFAPVERFAHAPRMVRPEAHLPNARTVIAMAIRYPSAMFEHAGRAPAENMFSMEVYQNHVIGQALYIAAMRVARFLEDAGHDAIPMCVSGRWRVYPYKDINTDWMADFSNRHAAVAAGLGEFGMHALCITPQYGMRQRFITVITSAPLDPTPMYAGPALCDRCMKCFKECPVKAINPRRMETVVIGDRTFTYATIDHFRCAWSEQTNMIPEEGPAFFGQTARFEPPPGRINDQQLLEAFYKKCAAAGFQTGTHAMGRCMGVCIPPHLRGTQKEVAPMAPLEGHRPR
ncbi:epoxyqueuosine reductase [bacterium]|nr:epoxyqueuosine reductase [bacterium]